MRALLFSLLLLCQSLSVLASTPEQCASLVGPSETKQAYLHDSDFRIIKKQLVRQLESLSYPRQKEFAFKRAEALAKWLRSLVDQLNEQPPLTPMQRKELWKLIDTTLNWSLPPPIYSRLPRFAARLIPKRILLSLMRRETDRFVDFPEQIDAEALIAVHRLLDINSPKVLKRLLERALDATWITDNLLSPEDDRQTEARLQKLKLFDYVLSRGSFNSSFWMDELLMSDQTGAGQELTEQLSAYKIKTLAWLTRDLSRFDFSLYERGQLARRYLESFTAQEAATFSLTHFSRTFDLPAPQVRSFYHFPLNSVQALELWALNSSHTSFELLPKLFERVHHELILKQIPFEFFKDALYQLLSHKDVAVERLVEIFKQTQAMLHLTPASQPLIDLGDWSQVRQILDKRSLTQFIDLVSAYPPAFSSLPPVEFLMTLTPEERATSLGLMAMRNTTSIHYVTSPALFDETPDGERLFYAHALAYATGRQEHSKRLIELDHFKKFDKEQRFEIASHCRQGFLLDQILSTEFMKDFSDEEKLEVFVNVARQALPMIAGVSPFAIDIRRVFAPFPTYQGLDLEHRIQLARFFADTWADSYPDIPLRKRLTAADLAASFRLPQGIARKIHKP